MGPAAVSIFSFLGQKTIKILFTSSAGGLLATGKMKALEKNSPEQLKALEK